MLSVFFFFFFFNDTATTEIYTLSLHDALPISVVVMHCEGEPRLTGGASALDARLKGRLAALLKSGDRKSTRLNSSHSQISYAVFCLKKKKKKKKRSGIEEEKIKMKESANAVDI